MLAEFVIGDKAVYPSQGVAEIIGIEKKEVFGKIQRFYVLRALDSGLRILVPVDKAEQVGLRRIAREEEIEAVILSRGQGLALNLECPARPGSVKAHIGTANTAPA